MCDPPPSSGPAAEEGAPLLPRVAELMPYPVAVVAGSDSRILAVNKAWARMAATSRLDPLQGDCLGGLFPRAAGAAHEVTRGGGVVSLRAVRVTASPGGTATWWDLDLVPHPSRRGCVHVTAREVTDHVLAVRDIQDARDALPPIAERLRLAQEAAGIGTWEWDLTTGAQSWSPHQFRLHGLDPAVHVPPRHAEWLRLVHPDDQRRVEAAFDALQSDAHRLEFRINRADTGAERWLLSLGRVTARRPDGRPARVLGINIDVTDRHADHERLRASEERLRLAASAAGLFAWEWDLRHDRVSWGEGLEAAFAVAPAAFSASHLQARARVHPAAAAAIEGGLTRGLDGTADSYRAEFRVPRPDGTTRWFASRGTVRRDAGGEPTRILGMVHDVTDSKATEAALQERERQLAALARLSRFALATASARAVMDEALRVVTEGLDAPYGHVLELLPGGQTCLLRAGLGWSAAWLVGEATIQADCRSEAGHTLLHGAGAVIIDDLRTERRFVPSALMADHRVISGLMVVIGPPDGTGPPYGVLGVFSATRRRFTEHDGRFMDSVAGLISLSLRHVRTEAALRHGQDRFQGLLDAMPQPAFTAFPDGQTDCLNRHFRDHTGLAAGADGWTAMVHPDDRTVIQRAWTLALRTGESFAAEHRLRGADGSYRWFLTRAVPLRAPDDGHVLRWLGICTDILAITSLRGAAGDASVTSALLENELARQAEVQTASVQAQKLQLLGQMTTGVVHDFRNIMAAILSALELVELRTDQPALRQPVSRAMAAVNRAISLTQQLLRFGRRKQVQVGLVNLGEALPESGDLIRGLIGPRISLSLEVAPGTWPVLADRDQLQVALLNLAVNARDAMPQGGTLRLTARNLCPAWQPADLPAGDYVSVRVSDTGEGMTPEVLARATEAFFTTKAEGHGTGLGLAMVHGFAEVARGRLRIRSLPREGSTIEIILPRAPMEDAVSCGSAAAGSIVVPIAQDDAHAAPVPAPAAAPGPTAPPADGFLARLRSPALREAFLFWQAARTGERPPCLADLAWGALPESDHAFMVAADIVADRISFRYLRFGRALQARLGYDPTVGAAPGEQLDMAREQMIGLLEGAYRRCARTLAPSYEYAKYDFGDDLPITFERLLLPVSDDGLQVTHLVGIVLFTDAG